MDEFKARIIENGKQRMASIRDDATMGPQGIAESLIYWKSIRDGAEVLMSELIFDSAAQTFKAINYTFDVENGLPKNLTKVK